MSKSPRTYYSYQVFGSTLWGLVLVQFNTIHHVGDEYVAGEVFEVVFDKDFEEQVMRARMSENRISFVQFKKGGLGTDLERKVERIPFYLENLPFQETEALLKDLQNALQANSTGRDPSDYYRGDFGAEAMTSAKALIHMKIKDLYNHLMSFVEPTAASTEGKPE